MMIRPDRTAVLKSFEKPVLFLIGKYDTAVPLNASLRQCHLPANSFIHILPHSGHVGMWEEEKSASSYLKKFFNNI
jgi:pimeloyl-ACP methyl ester carboxylesterase